MHLVHLFEMKKFQYEHDRLMCCVALQVWILCGLVQWTNSQSQTMPMTTSFLPLWTTSWLFSHVSHTLLTRRCEILFLHINTHFTPHHLIILIVTIFLQDSVQYYVKSGHTTNFASFITVQSFKVYTFTGIWRCVCFWTVISWNKDFT